MRDEKFKIRKAHPEIHSSLQKGCQLARWHLLILVTVGFRDTTRKIWQVLLFHILAPQPCLLLCGTPMHVYPPQLNTLRQSLVALEQASINVWRLSTSSLATSSMRQTQHAFDNSYRIPPLHPSETLTPTEPPPHKTKLLELTARKRTVRAEVPQQHGRMREPRGSLTHMYYSGYTGLLNDSRLDGSDMVQQFVL